MWLLPVKGEKKDFTQINTDFFVCLFAQLRKILLPVSRNVQLISLEPR